MNDDENPKSPPLRFPRHVHDKPTSAVEADALLPAPWAQVLADIPGGEHNLLHKRELESDLRVDFMPWAFSEPTPEEPETVDLFLDNLPEPVQSRSWEQAIELDDFFILLPQRFLTQGAHELTYRVLLRHAGVATGSLPFVFHIDRRVPELGQDRGRLVFPEEVLRELTANYLQAHDDRVDATAPDHQPIRIGDTLAWYWDILPGDGSVMGTRTLLASDIGRPIVLEWEGDRIRALGDDMRYASHEITSRAGYASGLSAPVPILTRVAEVPRRYPAPEVYDSALDKVEHLLEPLHASNGVTLRVPATAGLVPGDVIVMRWGLPGSVGALEVLVSANGAGVWQTRIDKATVLACMGTTVTIDYRLRDDDQVPPSEAFELSVADFAMSLLPRVQSKAGIDGQGHIRLSTLPEDGDTISLSPWPMMATTQKIKLWASGILANGIGDDYWLLEGATVTVGQTNNGVSIHLSRTWLASLEHNAPLHLHVQVSFDGGRVWKGFPSSGTLQVVP